jgi:hypothetical protein
MALQPCELCVTITDVDPDDSLEIRPGVFKPLGECTATEIEAAIRLIARTRIDSAWLEEQAAGPDYGDPTIGRRFFTHTTALQRELVAYWQLAKLREEEQLHEKSTDDPS